MSETNNIYYNKYLKYRKKYKNLKNKDNLQIGGSESRINNFNIVRPYNSEKNLILRYGNTKNINKDSENTYTIDLDQNTNPSCIANLKEVTFCNLPDNVFETVKCEGFFFSLDDADLFISEIKRVSKVDAKIDCVFKLKGAYRNSNGSWNNIYNKDLNLPAYSTFQDIDKYKTEEYSKLDDYQLNQSGNIRLYTLIKNEEKEIGKDIENLDHGINKVYLKNIKGENINIDILLALLL